ncbi:MAG: organic solvent tolerance protein OstA [Flavobacterium sp. BFFFF1]|uniref:putative LPS assembly protein LptD n=1 Tax=Flavobacterium sp. BFFFF1 TaxID=2015557 RepID=UPI000BCE7555|nr:putative LPS assembly protein LptD [Flavobacterium sp. BFFFF1]OYU80074.1 MAG: organic solvent tolerance protein OstA [Flavobacterium sp. BFFFF1]
MTPEKVSLIFTKIVFKPLRTNLFHIVLSATFLTLATAKTYAQDVKTNKFELPPKQIPDSNKVNAPEEVKLPLTTQQDPDKKPVLTDIIKRKAKDYERMNVKTKIGTLYNEAELYYQDVELKAGIIQINYEKNEIYAGRIKDSTGALTQRPVFKQGSNVIEPDSIRFNTETKKALIWNSRTKQMDFNIISEIAKKENDSVYFLKNSKFTTSENIDDPEYFILATKAKFVPKKKVVLGFSNLWIANVPTPIAIPFAFFPMTDKGQSGVIIPSFTDTNRQGYSLQNGGYYFALSDNYDLTFLGDYYTNGSYAMRFESQYAKRYRFGGNINIRFENQISGERGLPGYGKAREYNIQWSHRQDSKSNPNAKFTASVNLGSSTYFTNSLNQQNVSARLNNSLSSTISYSRTFNTLPLVNIAIAATHTQNTSTKAISMTLPTFTGSVDRVYPFAPKDGIKKGVIKNINLQYNIIAENRFNTVDSLFFKPEMFKNAMNGVKHQIPLSTNFKFAKFFSVPISVNYTEVWYIKTTKKEFDDQLNRVVDKDQNGFDAFRTYSFNTGVGTTVYGTFNFGEKAKIKSLRHVIKPSIGYVYTPSFDRYFDYYYTDPSKTVRKQYTRFASGIYGGPSASYSNVLSFALNNTLEAKVKDRDTTKTELKKIILLNSLNFQTSYDISADSLKWSPVRFSGGTAILKEKMNINFGGALDPYTINKAGRTINEFNINNGGSLFRLTNAFLTVGYTIDSKGGEKTTGSSDKQSQRNGGRDDDLFGRSTDLSDRRQSQFDDDKTEDNDTPAAFYHTKLPWDLNLAYSLSYSNNNRQNDIVGNSLMVSGNIDLAPKWKVGVSTGYDFVQKGITFTQLRFERDLLSWRMDFSWIPIGDNTSWGFFIGVKSGLLSDLKWEKRKTADRVIR